jgi:tetratricopeptide (TPR) repeat protein
MLVGGIAGTSFGLVRAERARRESQAREAETKAVLDFVEQKVFAAARPEGQEGGLGYDVTLRRAIEAAVPFVDESFKDRPLIEAQLRQTLGISFLYLGEAKKAEEQFEKARAIRTKELGPDHPDTHNSMQGLAVSYNDLGRHAEALKLNEETLAIRKVKLGPDHPETLAIMHNLANNYAELGRHAEALKLREETLALLKAKLGPDHPGTLLGMLNLAISYAELGRHDDALKLHEETLALRKAKLGPDHPDTLDSMRYLASSYSDVGRHAEALELHEATLALRKAKLGPDHPRALDSMRFLADSYADLGRDAEALKLHEELVGLRKAKLGSDRPNTLIDDSPSAAVDRDLLRQSYEELATTLFSQRRFDEAEQAMREAIALYADVPIDDVGVGVGVAWTHYNFGLGLYLVDRVQDAAEQFREAFRRFEHVLAQAPEGDGAHTQVESALRWTLLTCPLPQFRNPERALKLIQQKLQGEPSSGDLWNSLGIAHYRLGQWDEAITAYQKSIELRSGGDSSDFYFLAMAHWQRGEQDEARQWYHLAVEHKGNQGGSNNPDLLNFRQEAEKLMGVTRPQPSTDTNPP